MVGSEPYEWAVGISKRIDGLAFLLCVSTKFEFPVVLYVLSSPFVHLPWLPLPWLCCPSSLADTPRRKPHAN